MKNQGSTFVGDDPEPQEADKKPEPPPKNPKIETVVVPFETVLNCKLTDTETLAYAREAADVKAAITKLKADMKSLVKDCKDKIALKQARHEALTAYVVTGCERRTVKCERIFDYKKRLVTERRLDGQEPAVIAERGMRRDDLQPQMELIVR